MQVNSGFAKVNATKLYYEILGEGHPLVLIHGGLMDRRMWDHQFNLFAKDYKVIRYNLRGYEKSDVPKDKFSHMNDLYPQRLLRPDVLSKAPVPSALLKTCRVTVKYSHSKLVLETGAGHS